MVIRVRIFVCVCVCVCKVGKVWTKSKIRKCYSTYNICLYNWSSVGGFSYFKCSNQVFLGVSFSSYFLFQKTNFRFIIEAMESCMYVLRISLTPHCPLTILTVHFF